ncbi:hypothetical protein ACFL9T_05710 [Thermodesulfobacteriota bacterium]
MTKNSEELAKEYGIEVYTTSFTPDSLDDYSRTSNRFGLVWDQAWAYTTVTSVSGQRYAFIRGYEKAVTGMTMSSKLTEDMNMVSPRTFDHLYIGPVYFDLVEEKEMFRIKSWPARNNFQFDVAVNRMHWQEENGELDLHWEALGPACRILTPGAKIQEDMFYTSEICEVKGTVHGEEVSGFGGFDQCWLPPGIGWTQGKIYTYVQNYWIPWANRYADGSIEYGVTTFGAGDWSVGFFVENGKPYISNDNEINMTWGDYEGDRVPLNADVRHGQHHFKWTAGSRVSKIKGNMKWVDSKMINKARKDEPVETFSWNEYRTAQD